MEPYSKKIYPNPSAQNQDVDKTESVENFQKFIFDLFDKNGILNDLRAYLRGHIVDVLKSAQTGDPPSYQKHFTQRLESTFQALNMLIAEYLLCLDFNYSLSVFVSEIPLANMVFGLAKALMGLGADGGASKLRFGENDVWSILNYLGVKCDSDNANAIIDMYKAQEKTPLLVCILKCAQLCETQQMDDGSNHSSSTSSKSSLDKRSVGSQCKHAAFCKTCRGRYKRLQEKYRKKKARYLQKAQANAKALNVKTLMKNIGELERSLIDEMFEQLKTVYESEIDMFKAEHERKLKNSLDSHVKHFQQMHDELERSYKAREEALRANIVHKKRFLWGLAKALREQHSHMTKAMQALKKQTAQIAEQEHNLKLQRTEAEESLKKRAEEMRQQIADELIILEQHLNTMRTERDSITKERSSENKINMDVKNYLQDHYHLWKEELNILKMYIGNVTFPPKSVTERSTVTDDVCKGMNNEIERDRGIAREGRPNQVVNDLKKLKNVNFNQQGKLEGELRTRSPSSSEDEGLRDEIQPSHVRPISPQRPPASLIEHSLREIECGWQKGAGEEHSLLPSSRILVPGDTLPFVGVVGRRSDSRRHLLNRWRVLRRRVSSPSPPPPPPPPPADTPGFSAKNVEVGVLSPSSEPIRNKDENRQETTSTPTRDAQSKVATATDSPDTREKSPSSVLKEAKEKLKTVIRASTSRSKSPSAVLREAKRRLRKLEIEAEAVERSYMDFRRRRERGPDCDDVPTCIPSTGSKLSTHYKEEVPEHSKSQLHATDSIHLDLEKYLKKYQINLDLAQDHFKNRNTAATIKSPVPKAYTEINSQFKPTQKEDYLDKPIFEFRKLYYTNPERAQGNRIRLEEPTPFCKSKENSGETVKKTCADMRKDNMRKELEIVKQNITKTYDLQDAPTKENDTISKEENSTDNLLLVEVENINEIKPLNVEQQTDVVIVIETSVDSKAVVSAREDSADHISNKMTILVSPKEIDRDVTIERIGLPVERRETPSGQDFTRNIITEEFLQASGVNFSPKIESHSEPDFVVQSPPHSVFETVKIKEDYSDDFSDDVDNYKSDDNSPISLPKTSEDENFWD